MSTAVRKLSPKTLWKNFADLNAVPRASKKEEQVIAFAKGFGEKLGLETIVDEVGNVIIKKPGTKGKENATTVVMQSHLDMVHQKNADTKFDFSKEGIQMVVEDDWVKAKGTTLGADNGLGVAAIMAILESTDIPHPPIEALFTIDEETGMTGAMGLKGGLLNGKIMLNLDTEDDHELTIGCAGGIDVTATGKYNIKTINKIRPTYRVSIKGLTGGHSGMDIHLGRGNANKLMNRFLYEAQKEINLRIHSIDGGSLRNAIPRESFADIIVKEEEETKLLEFTKSFGETLNKEYSITDGDIQVIIEKSAPVNTMLGRGFQKRLIRSIYACPNGIYRMSPDIKDLVQTSNNLARVLVKDGKFEILCLTRSSVESEKMDEANAIKSTFELMGAKVVMNGGYPGWTPNPNSTIVKLMSDLYREMFDGEANEIIQKWK